MKYPVHNLKGEKTGTIDLPSGVFGIKSSHDLLHQVIVSQESNLRRPIAHTKTRGEVRGGGKKPWRQKGTGRARHGSIRSPIWAGGGITFGPRNERNFHKKINKKMAQKAILMALSSKATDNQLVIFDDWAQKEPKTKVIAKAISTILNLPKPKTLFVVDAENKNVRLAARNCSGSHVVSAGTFNALDVLKKKFLALSEEEINLIKMRFKK